MTAILCHVDHDDAFDAGFRRALAAAAGVAEESLVEIRSLAERVLTPGAGDLAVLADRELWIGCRRPRAIRALLAVAGITLSAVDIHWVTDAAENPAAPGAPPRQPWYPVIDRERCINCGQCRQFCLFDVYTTRATGTVEVARPLRCKPGCPACARLCPRQAIIFPFCPEAPINGDFPDAAATATTGAASPASAPDALPASRGAAVSPAAIEAALARRRGTEHRQS